MVADHSGGSHQGRLTFTDALIDRVIYQDEIGIGNQLVDFFDCSLACAGWNVVDATGRKHRHDLRCGRRAPDHDRCSRL